MSTTGEKPVKKNIKKVTVLNKELFETTGMQEKLAAALEKMKKGKHARAGIRNQFHSLKLFLLRFQKNPSLQCRKMDLPQVNQLRQKLSSY